MMTGEGNFFSFMRQQNLAGKKSARVHLQEEKQLLGHEHENINMVANR